MTDLEQIIAVGTLLIIETGEYSDRRWDGPVRMLRSASRAQLAREYREQWTPPDEWTEKPTEDGFLPWLVKAGYAEAVDGVMSWHVGNYGDFEP